MSNKYAFFRTKASFIIIGLILGLFTGFKVANSQYRREQGKSFNSAVAKSASSQPGQDAAHATEEIQSIIEKAKGNPNDAAAQMEAASQFMQIERPREAMPFLEQADKVKPNDPRINAGLGFAQFMMGNLDQATTLLKRARDLGAKEPSITALLVGAYIETGKNLDEADRLLKEIESMGIEPGRLVQIRADLAAARSGKKAGVGADGGASVGGSSKTMLNHGPENGGGRK